MNETPEKPLWIQCIISYWTGKWIINRLVILSTFVVKKIFTIFFNFILKYIYRLNSDVIIVSFETFNNFAKTNYVLLGILKLNRFDLPLLLLKKLNIYNGRKLIKYIVKWSGKKLMKLIKYIFKCRGEKIRGHSQMSNVTHKVRLKRSTTKVRVQSHSPGGKRWSCNRRWWKSVYL